jgi:hypothetical protein
MPPRIVSSQQIRASIRIDVNRLAGLTVDGKISLPIAIEVEVLSMT